MISKSVQIKQYFTNTSFKSVSQKITDVGHYINNQF